MKESLKKFSLKEVKSNHINLKEAIDKGLVVNENYDKYIEVQGLYRKIFEEYVNSLFSFRLIDEKLKSSNLGYSIIDQKDRHPYHQTSYLLSDYVFIRNFYYVERLTSQQISLFLEALNQDKIELEKLLPIVKETFQDIIMGQGNNTNSFQIFYGMVSPINSFSNDALVIFINFGRNEEKLSDEEFLKNKLEKERLLDEIIGLLNNELKEKLKCKIETRWYKGKLNKFDESLNG